MNYRREGNDSSDVQASDPLLETERRNIVVKYKCPLCRHVMAVIEALHNEHGQLHCSKCVTWATRRNGARFSAACDNELPVSEAQALLFADDGACDEVSSLAEEANLPPDSTAVRDQLQLIEPCEGDEALNVFYPIQVENLLSDQRVETPELPTYQQEDCALHNGLSSPTPEPAVQDAPPPADSLVGYPVQESDQDVRGSYLVQETSGLRLLRGYDQSRCQQQTNDFQINGVSSLGENDQAIQQSLIQRFSSPY